jgi:DNA-binding NarL/FixJ family response regulator
MTRVLLADDHMMVGDAIANLLETSGRVTVVARAADGREALTMTRTLRPEVLILDLFMPVMGGLEAARILNRNRVDSVARVIVLAEHHEDRNLAKAIGVGVRGYLSKALPVQELVQAVATVASGGAYFNPAAPSTDAPNSLELSSLVLTPREHQVLQLIAEGHSNKEIGSLLELSTKTVEHHRERLMTRLHIHDIAGLTRYAVRQGIILP